MDKGLLTGQWAEGSPPQHHFPSGLLGGTVVALTYPVEARAFPGLAIALIRVPEGQEASSGTWLPGQNQHDSSSFSNNIRL